MKRGTRTPSRLPDLADALANVDRDARTLGKVTNASAKAAVKSLKRAITAARAATTAGRFHRFVGDLEGFLQAAEAAAQKAADDFVADQSASRDAETAQRASAMLQDFSAAVAAALSRAVVVSMAAMTTPRRVTRTTTK